MPVLLCLSVVNVNTSACGFTQCSVSWRDDADACAAAGPVWKVLLDAVSDSRPYTITATLRDSPSHTIQLHDVLFGDVWLCVGQNKLHHSVAKVFTRSVHLWKRNALLCRNEIHVYCTCLSVWLTVVMTVMTMMKVMMTHLSCYNTKGMSLAGWRCLGVDWSPSPWREVWDFAPLKAQHFS